MSDALFQIWFSYPTGGTGEDGVSLRVHDEVSGVVLCDVRLDSQQFVSMMRGGVVSAVQGQRSAHLNRVGKAMQNDMFPVPREVVTGFLDGADLVHAWAEKQPWRSDWDTVEARLTNVGWKVVVRRWVNPS